MSSASIELAKHVLMVFGIILAMGTGEFSVSAALLDLLKQSLFGLIAGVVLGSLAAMLIASVTFLAVLMTILIQATTTRWLAEKLGLLVEG